MMMVQDEDAPDLYQSRYLHRYDAGGVNIEVGDADSDPLTYHVDVLNQYFDDPSNFLKHC